MVPKLLRLFPIVAFFAVVACEGQKKTSLQDRVDKDNFFSGIEKTMTPADLENEMAGGETDFLRSFANGSTPWQHWDSSILEKASRMQTPIFLLVGSSLGGDSLSIGKEISESADLRASIADQFVCSVADIHAQPELGILAFHLSSEINRPTSFPTLIWMSPEGSPIAWIPISGATGRQLAMIIKNAAAMVTKIWDESSNYAVVNSRNDNKSRQERFSFSIPDESSGPLSRGEVFKTQTRQLSSLYSAGDRDLDFIGGLIPTSSLELLSLGSISNALTEEVNERCRKATTEVIEEIIRGALKDHLDGSYFYARRTNDWSLPSFSKSITSQAKVAHMLIQAGTITGRQDFINEGLQTLQILETEWLEKSRVHTSPSGDQDAPGKFLWNWSTLEKAIGRELVPFAAAAFSMEKDGNIPSEADPIGTFFRLNSLRSRVSIPDLATQFSLSEVETRNTLDQIKAQLLSYRNQTLESNIESVLNCTDMALILRAWTAAAVVSNDPAYLQKAETLASRLSGEFIDPEKGLARLPLQSGFMPARASDYGSASIALSELYQITLNPDHLKLSKDLIDQALGKLKCENGLISEAPPEGQVIPLRIIQPAMIFSDSSLGLVDLAVTQLRGITGSSEYDGFREKVTMVVAPMAGKAAVNHTDFISTCAQGDPALVAVFQGQASSEKGRILLSLLNSKKHLPFLSVRAESGPQPLTPLENLPPVEEEASVVLMQGKEILGQASDSEQLNQLISRALFSRD